MKPIGLDELLKQLSEIFPDLHFLEWWGAKDRGLSLNIEDWTKVRDEIQRLRQVEKDYYRATWDSLNKK